MFGYVLRSKEQDEAYRNGCQKAFEMYYDKLTDLYRSHVQILEETVATQKEVIEKQRVVISLLEDKNKKLEDNVKSNREIREIVY